MSSVCVKLFNIKNVIFRAENSAKGEIGNMIKPVLYLIHKAVLD